MRGKPRLLVLGSPHLANPGRDYVNAVLDDVLQPSRQQEIAALVYMLAAFRPTKIAVEVLSEDDEKLNEDYSQYLRGSFMLTRSEVHQIGFRLAVKLGHPRVYAVDWLGDPPAGLDVDFEAFAREHGQAHLFEQALQAARNQAMEEERILAERGLVDLYRWMNRPETLLQYHRVYFTIAQIGAGKRYPGANWVGEWYGRNLRIFVNLTRITEDGDRVLLIVGAGHAWLLRQFAQESGLYELEDPLKYLGWEGQGSG